MTKYESPDTEFKIDGLRQDADRNAEERYGLGEIFIVKPARLAILTKCPTESLDSFPEAQESRERYCSKFDDFYGLMFLQIAVYNDGQQDLTARIHTAPAAPIKIVKWTDTSPLF